MYHMKLHPTKMNGAGKELEASGFEKKKTLLPSVLEPAGGTAQTVAINQDTMNLGALSSGEVLRTRNNFSSSS